MPVSEQAGRANRPDLRETIVHTDDLKELLESRISAQREIMDERDQRYAERFKAMDEKTSLALAASEKAVGKAEMATEKRFDSVNEFRAQLKDQAATLMPREEADTKFSGIDKAIDELKENISSLREYRSAVDGGKVAQSQALDQKQFDIRTLLSVAALLLSIISTIAAITLFILRQKP